MSEDMGLRLSAAIYEALGEEEWAAMFARDGMARHVTWRCRDGWLVGYTTNRIRYGQNDGKFAAMAWKPIGKGARTGNPERWERVYLRTFAKRKSARARAVKMYHQHNE